MQLKRFASVFVLSLVALVATPGSDRAEADATDRPIWGTGEGVVTEIVTPAHWVIEYAGTATHLGKFTRRADLYFTGPGTFEGTIQFVAANGDELDVEFDGHFVSPNDAVATYTFVGGTGRFTDATGTATVTASTPDFVHVSFAFEGRIDY